MKVTLDLDKLLEEDRISRAEYDKLLQLAAHGTASLAFNILVGFGVAAVSVAALALIPAPGTAIALGLAIGAAGIALPGLGARNWTALAGICVILGALLFGGGIIADGKGSIGSFLLVAAVFAAAGVFARSSLLTVLAVLALSSCLGARTGYFHATYFLGIEQPALTVAGFTLFSAIIYQVSRALPADSERIAIAAARTGVFLVNFGFWIGSLWGDRTRDGGVAVDSGVFAALWAVALAAAGAWAWRQNRRWLVNVVAVFGSIHFYTQWFERLGASPQSLLFGGLLALGFALGLWALNHRLGEDTQISRQ